MAGSGWRRAAALGAAAGAVLAGCQIDAQYAAQCTTSPPVPHQDNGVVDVSFDIPLTVEPGQTFEVTVFDMDASNGSTGQFRGGSITVTGPVYPSGNIPIGSRAEVPYPQTLMFRATGQPGEVIHFDAEDGFAIYGDILTNAYGLSCDPGSPEIGTTTITAPGA